MTHTLKTNITTLSPERLEYVTHHIYCQLGMCGASDKCFPGAAPGVRERWLHAVKGGLETLNAEIENPPDTSAE